ncbi:MAG: hypothetical protein HC769_34400 [Cyanobacteria bacterium CRU_2_1]|nr:hypothetical protein [Cyanobacteria bacterium CRU_2_1]
MAEAGKNPAEQNKQTVARNALRWLKGLLGDLTQASAIVQLGKDLLPQIATIFGLA